ncbi:MAG: UDPGP type 1 family protein [Thermogutta sp.]|nr:UDPGP type 1 family protein [Thermogutta sp.]
MRESDRREYWTRRLREYDQGHLLAAWDDLSPDRREALLESLQAVDFDLIRRLYENRGYKPEIGDLLRNATSPRGPRLSDRADAARRRAAVECGEEALRGGRAACVLVAGGQGSRLGFEHPKGMFPIGPLSRHSLFQIFAEKILARGKRYGRRLPLALMTSPLTHAETVDYFERHERFGLGDDLHIFCQGTMPAVDATTGRILMARPDALALSPDGHGGMLAAIHRSGVLERFRQEGVRHLFYFQVDNPLLDVADPEFIGWHILAGSEMSTLVIAKQTPLDKVGNVVQVGDRLHVVEYSDLPQDLAVRPGLDGKPLLWAGSIGVHVMEVDFLARVADLAEALPFHVALKKMTYYDPETRTIVEPETANAVKFERFIFDLIPHAENAIVIEAAENDQFAPLKNAPGAARDTPEYVRDRMAAKCRRLLREAGCETPGDPIVEISPLFALDSWELSQRLPRGTRIASPTYFGPEGPIAVDAAGGTQGAG